MATGSTAEFFKIFFRMIPAGTIFAKASGRELKSEAKGLWFRDKETPKTTLGPAKNSSTILRSD